MYCPGHAGVKGNGQADRLADAADVKQGLTLGTLDVLRHSTERLRHYRKKVRDRTTQEHHSIERRKERGVHRGSGRWSTLKGRKRAVINQINVGSVKGNFGESFEEWGGAHMGIPERRDATLNLTELN